MTIITHRNCGVCGTEMKCTRATKLFCSVPCTNKANYQKKKLGISMEQVVEFFRNKLEEKHNEI